MPVAPMTGEAAPLRCSVLRSSAVLRKMGANRCARTFKDWGADAYGSKVMNWRPALSPGGCGLSLRRCAPRCARLGPLERYWVTGAAREARSPSERGEKNTRSCAHRTRRAELGRTDRSAISRFPQSAPHGVHLRMRVRTFHIHRSRYSCSGKFPSTKVRSQTFLKIR